MDKDSASGEKSSQFSLRNFFRKEKAPSPVTTQTEEKKVKVDRRTFLKLGALTGASLIADKTGMLNLAAQEQTRGEPSILEEEKSVECMMPRMANILDTLDTEAPMTTYVSNKTFEEQVVHGTQFYLNLDEVGNVLPRNEITESFLGQKKSPESYCKVSIYRGERSPETDEINNEHKLNFEITLHKQGPESSKYDEGSNQPAEEVVYSERYNEQTNLWSRKLTVVKGKDLYEYGTDSSGNFGATLSKGQKAENMAKNPDASPATDSGFSSLDLDKESVESMINSIVPTAYLQERFKSGAMPGFIISENEENSPDAMPVNMRKLLDTLDPNVRVDVDGRTVAEGERRVLSKNTAKDMKIFPEGGGLINYALTPRGEKDSVIIMATEEDFSKDFTISILSDVDGVMNTELIYRERVDSRGIARIDLDYKGSGGFLDTVSLMNTEEIDDAERERRLGLLRMVMPEPYFKDNFSLE